MTVVFLCRKNVLCTPIYLKIIRVVWEQQFDFHRQFIKNLVDLMGKEISFCFVMILCVLKYIIHVFIVLL